MNPKTSHLHICQSFLQTFHKKERKRSILFVSMAPLWVKKLTPSGPQGSELLEQERAQSNVPVKKLSEFLFTKEVLARQERVLDILKAEKVFNKSQNYFDGREARFQTALARAKRHRQLAIQHRWSQDEYMMASELISEPGPYGLHASMFLVRLLPYVVSSHLRILTLSTRSHFETRELLNSMKCFSRKLKTTNSSVVTHRPN